MLALAIAICFILFLLFFPVVRFFFGTIFIIIGELFQDAYGDLEDSGISTEEIYAHVVRRNRIGSWIRKRVPRRAHNAKVAIVLCMERMLDANDVLADSRRGLYFKIRVAGSALTEENLDALRLAVNNGVRVILWTVHTGCAAEAAAASESGRYPALSSAIWSREATYRRFVGHREIAPLISSGELLVVRMMCDKSTGALVEQSQA